MVLAEGVSEAPDIKVGRNVSVSSGKKELGEFTVLSVQHSVSSTGQYWNRFEAVPGEVSFPPANPLTKYPVCVPQTAVVVENSDPLGRVRVRFPWQEDNESTPWIRVLNVHAGKDRGSHIMPEKEDEVMVAFEHMNPDRPYVTGSLYHEKVYEEWNSKENHKKALKTKSGNVILISDEPGKETIQIANKDDKNLVRLTLEGNGQITIQTEGDLLMKAKNIKMESETLTVEAQKSHELTTQELTMSSQNAELNASGQMKIDGGSKASVKAGMIELN